MPKIKLKKHRNNHESINEEKHPSVKPGMLFLWKERNPHVFPFMERHENSIVYVFEKEIQCPRVTVY